MIDPATVHPKFRLKAARKAKGLTQIALARKLALSQGAIAMWEAGAALPTDANAAAISKALGVTADWLFKGAPLTDEDRRINEMLRSELDDFDRQWESARKSANLPARLTREETRAQFKRHDKIYDARKAGFLLGVKYASPNLYPQLLKLTANELADLINKTEGRSRSRKFRLL